MASAGVDHSGKHPWFDFHGDCKGHSFVSFHKLLSPNWKCWTLQELVYQWQGLIKDKAHYAHSACKCIIADLLFCA